METGTETKKCSNLRQFQGPDDFFTHYHINCDEPCWFVRFDGGLSRIERYHVVMAHYLPGMPPAQLVTKREHIAAVVLISFDELFAHQDNAPFRTREAARTYFHAVLGQKA